MGFDIVLVGSSFEVSQAVGDACEVCSSLVVASGVSVACRFVVGGAGRQFSEMPVEQSADFGSA